VLLCLDVFLTLLALMVWPGGDINLMRQIQGATLSHTKVNANSSYWPGFEIDFPIAKLSELLISSFRTLPFWAKYCNNFLLFYGLCLEVIVRRDW
jgi:hypothetical protein